MIKTPEEVAEDCLPSTNWPDRLLWQLPPPELDFDPDPETRSVPLIDVWKSRRIAIAKMIGKRDTELVELCVKVAVSAYLNGDDEAGIALAIRLVKPEDKSRDGTRYKENIYNPPRGSGGDRRAKK